MEKKNGFHFTVILVLVLLIYNGVMVINSTSTSTRSSSTCSIRISELRVENTINPIGLDVYSPRLSWKIMTNDDENGKKEEVVVYNNFNLIQESYHIIVSSSIELLQNQIGNVWDSGVVFSSQMNQISFPNDFNRTSPPLLHSFQRVYWKVQVQVQANTTVSIPIVQCSNDWSTTEAGFWEMGILNKQDWSGSYWIQRKPIPPKSDCQMYEDDPVPLFRKEFKLLNYNYNYNYNVVVPILQARLYVSGLGFYECYINGQRVGDSVLDPAWTTYSKQVFYSTYDVTDLMNNKSKGLAGGVIGCMVGNGWYNPLPMKFWGSLNLRDHLNVVGSTPILKLTLRILYDDANNKKTIQQVINTDSSWKVSNDQSPLVRNNIYLGEIYDSRKEALIEGWNSQIDFNDTHWDFAYQTNEDSSKLGPLISSTGLISSVKIMQTWQPAEITSPSPGVYIFNMGQNFAGWVTLKISSKNQTTPVVLKYGELLYNNGSLNVMTSVAGQIKRPGEGGPCCPPIAFQSDTYIPKNIEADSIQSYTPRFTWHGFQYVEVSGLKFEPDLSTLTAHRIGQSYSHSSSNFFNCSNTVLNKIQSATLWSMYSNINSGVQSDCPHRERFGYGGDVVASGGAALWNFPTSFIENFYENRIREFGVSARKIYDDNHNRFDLGFTETAPFVGISDSGLGNSSGPVGWGTVHSFLQWELYTRFNNTRILKEQYNNTKEWVDLLLQVALQQSGGLILNNGLSDWMSIAPRPIELTGTAFFYLNAKICAQICDVLKGKQEKECIYYENLANQIKDQFNDKFLDLSTGIYDKGTQASQAFALALDLVPSSPEVQQKVLEYMIKDIMIHNNGHLTTGMFGNRYMLNSLSQYNRSDIAYTLASQTTYPGWGFMIANNATTLWESWFWSDNTYSHNHHMFGSISEWFYTSLAGINQVHVSNKNLPILIRPQPPNKMKTTNEEGVQWVKAAYDSTFGPVEVEWNIQEEEKVGGGGGRVGSKYFEMNITIPVNSRAQVCIPGVQGKCLQVIPTTTGKQQQQQQQEPKLAAEDSTLVLGSGKYRCTSLLL